jgi:hypothetical protein
MIQHIHNSSKEGKILAENLDSSKGPYKIYLYPHNA